MFPDHHYFVTLTKKSTHFEIFEIFGHYSMVILRKKINIHFLNHHSIVILTKKQNVIFFDQHYIETLTQKSSNFEI